MSSELTPRDRVWQPLRLLERGEASPGDRAPSREDDLEIPRGELLACALCLSPITREGWRVEVFERREHTCVNPAGEVFHVGCFAQAPGALAAGTPTTFFSWFEGYAWSHALCLRCGVQLGWFFSSEAGAFFGLILDRLVPLEEE